MYKLMLRYPCPKCGEWNVDYYRDGDGKCNSCGASFPVYTFPCQQEELQRLESEGKIHRGLYCYHYGDEETCPLCNMFVRELHERTQG